MKLFLLSLRGRIETQISSNSFPHSQEFIQSCSPLTWPSPHPSRVPCHTLKQQCTGFLFFSEFTVPTVSRSTSHCWRRSLEMSPSSLSSASDILGYGQGEPTVCSFHWLRGYDHNPLGSSGCRTDRSQKHGLQTWECRQVV